MFYIQSLERFEELGIDTYSISKTSFIFVVLIRKEGANPRSSPTIYRDSEGNLNFVARMNEPNIVVDPKDFVKLNPFLLPEEILWLLLVHDKGFPNQCVSSPLIKSISSKDIGADSRMLIPRTTHVCLLRRKNCQ
jgi:hypothetical protein